MRPAVAVGALLFLPSIHRLSAVAVGRLSRDMQTRVPASRRLLSQFKLPAAKGMQTIALLYPELASR